MKVAFLVPGFSSDERDWCIPALLDYVRLLAQRAEVHVFALRYPHRVDRYKVYGATVHSLNGVGSAGLRSPALWARAVREMAAEHRAAPFDVLHAFWAYEPGPVAVWAGQRLGVPVVVSLAGGELARIPQIHYGLQFWPHRRALIRWALGRSQAVTAGSYYLLDQLSGELMKSRPDRSARPARSRYAPLGVDTQMFAPGAVETGADCTRVLSVGSLAPVKGHEVLLRALSRATRDISNVRLTLAGADSSGLRPELERLAEQLGLSRKVEFVGEVRHEALPDLYRSAAFCAQASLHEAQGMAVLEAAACGVPTLGSAVGILPELAPADWLARPGDVEGLAGLIASGINRPQALRELGRNLRAKIEQEFSLEASLERFWQIYLDVTHRT